MSTEIAYRLPRQERWHHADYPSGNEVTLAHKIKRLISLGASIYIKKHGSKWSWLAGHKYKFVGGARRIGFDGRTLDQLGEGRGLAVRRENARKR